MSETTTLITGANRGIGLELARIAAVRGCRVIAACRRPDEAGALHEMAAAHPKLEIVPLTVDDPESVAVLVERLAGTRLDVLINNAGTMGPPGEEQAVDSMRFDGWPELFAVNTIGPVRLLHGLRANLQRSALGKAVTITSQMGAIAVDMPFSLAYCASKAAVNKIMRLLGPEYREHGVVVSLLHPGWVRTDMGGDDADVSVEESASGMWAVIDKLTLDDAGSFYSWTGQPHPW